MFGYDPKSGCRACAHVHGFFPYFYIKVHELLHLFKDSINIVYMIENFVIDFINSIHKAYCSTFFQQFNN